MSAQTGGKGSVGRIALPARAVIGLVRIVVGAVRPVTVVTPPDMRVAPIDATRLAGQRAANDRAGNEGCGGEPVAVMVAIARTAVTIAAMTSGPGISASRRKLRRKSRRSRRKSRRMIRRRYCAGTTSDDTVGAFGTKMGTALTGTIEAAANGNRERRSTYTPDRKFFILISSFSYAWPLCLRKTGKHVPQLTVCKKARPPVQRSGSEPFQMPVSRP
jgi:hypothetical protein